MSWQVLDLDPIPDLPEPHIITPPPTKPDVPDSIQERLFEAERRQANMFVLLLLVGEVAGLLGLELYQIIGLHYKYISDKDPIFGWFLLGMFVLIPMFAILGSLGWRPRQQMIQQAYEYVQWRSRYHDWIIAERQRYAASLTPDEQAYFTAFQIPDQWRPIMASPHELRQLERHHAVL